MKGNWIWRASGLIHRNTEGKKDYAKHDWDRKEMFFEINKCILIVVLFSFYFYRSLWAMLPLSFLGILCLYMDNNKKKLKDKRVLLLQFRDMIQAVAADMRAGYSIENSFLECYPDMCMMHGKDSFICGELMAIRRGLAINITLEELLFDFGKRSQIPQVMEFSAVFSIAKKSGGNLTDVIRTFAELIQRNAELYEEIMIQTAGRRMERNIMLLMPFLFLSYIEISNPGYFDSFYFNLKGIGMMSVCLGIYIAAYMISEHILEQSKKL